MSRVLMSLMSVLKCPLLPERSFFMTLFSFLALSFSSIDLAKLFNTGSMLLVFKHRHCLSGNFFNFVDALGLLTLDDTLHSMLTDN